MAAMRDRRKSAPAAVAVCIPFGAESVFANEQELQRSMAQRHNIPIAALKIHFCFMV
jgi:hypothetical protein